MNDTNSNNTPESNIPTKVKFSLICASKVKKRALELSKTTRAGKFTRVSQDFLMDCERALENHIKSKIHSHPSVGKTLM